MAEARLQKIIADAGMASRRGAEALIVAGRVLVDGTPAHLGQRVDPATARIVVDGRPIATPSRRVYLALDKPIGVTSTVHDRHAARTVLDLVPDTLRVRAGRLYPVGRLDRDSEGLLLLTNDGAWAQQVAHPSHELEREYAVQTAWPLDQDHAARLLAGIDLEEGLARLVAIRPATDVETARLLAVLAGPPRDGPWYRVTVAQGWRRQLRRMFAAAGVPVRRLARVRIGPLWLAGLAAGEIRELTAAEVHRLGRASPGGRSEAGGEASATKRGGLIVSLDGPASSGKSTVGAAAARRLQYRFCDTGLLYRALTWLALERGTSLAEEAGLSALAPEIELAEDGAGRLTRVTAHGRDVTAAVHDVAVDRHVSEVARQPAVRAALLPVQRSIAAAGRIVMAGRDIGTAILPHADLKLYLDVSVEERARRRVAQRGLDPRAAAAGAVAEDLRHRDEVDSRRAVGPLRIPPDATIVHSDGRTLAQTVKAVVALVRAAERRA